MATSKYWVKLYHETVTDWKFMRLPDPARLLFYDCLCMAGDMDAGGRLPPISGMAFILHKTEAYITDAIKPLLESRMILQDEDGNYYLANFEKRQGGMTGNERVQRYRNNMKHTEYKNATYVQRNGNDSCNDDVTIRYTEEEVDIEIDKEEEGKLSGDFEHVKNMLSCVSRVLGLPVLHGGNDYNIQAAKEMVKNGIIEQDLQTGFDWLLSVGKTATSAHGLIGPATTAKNKRTKSKPVKTKPMFNMDEEKWEDVPA